MGIQMMLCGFDIQALPNSARICRNILSKGKPKAQVLASRYTAYAVIIYGARQLPYEH